MIINLIDRVKFSFRKNKELLASLHDILGFYPHNLELFRIALAHKSQTYRNRNGRTLNNERLEFLGDAILEAIVSDIVFHRYERKPEGFLTSTRSKVVQRSSLNRLAAEVGLDKLIKANLRNSSHNSYVGGNAFEALIGAIYLDRGYDLCKWFIEKRIVGRLLDLDGVAKKEVNFKSKLLEWTQKNRILASYDLEQTENEGSNNPVFNSVVTIEGLVAGKGKGYSKKESQQQAAKEALTKLRREPSLIDSIFRAKEKRTAMEAGEICCLPKIDEIEEELAAEGSTTPEREKPRRAQRRSAGNDGEATPAAGASATENGTEKPAAKKRRRRKPAARKGEGQPGEAATDATTAEKRADKAEPASGARPEGEAPARKPRRPRRKPETATDGEQPAADGRENIIRQAEEVAFQAAQD